MLKKYKLLLHICTLLLCLTLLSITPAFAMGWPLDDVIPGLGTGNESEDGGSILDEFLSSFGGLSVENVVTGSDVDTLKQWSYTVTLDNTSITGIYGDMYFVNGVSSFVLSGGEMKVARNLPVGTNYTVTQKEMNVDGYTTTAVGDTGTIAEDEIAQAIFTNDRATGSLSVSLSVADGETDAAKEWHFRITLNSNIFSNGLSSGIIFKNGVAEFTMKNGEKKTVSGLPDGVGYTVEELDADQNGYRTTKVGDTGTISNGQTAEAMFLNEKKASGTISVENIVIGADETNRDLEWHFRVFLNDNTFTGGTGGFTFVNGVAEFTLKQGEKKATTGLPADVTYIVSETEENQYGFKTTYVGESGTIPENGTVRAIFTNEAETSGGDLSVQVVVSGNGDKTKEWHFRVVLNSSFINGTYGDMTFAEGRAMVTLKHLETAKAIGLPVGTTFTVTEQEENTEGYTTTYEGTTGTISAGASMLAKFENAKSGLGFSTLSPNNKNTPEPSSSTDITGEETEEEEKGNSFGFWMLIMVLAFIEIAALGLCVYRKVKFGSVLALYPYRKAEKKNKHKK